MQTIKLKDKPFLVIGSSGQEETLTQDIVDNYNSIAINKSPFKVDIIFRYDVPNDNLTKLDMCNYFCTNIKYKDYEKYQNNKCKFFESEYRIISKELPVLGFYRFTVTGVLNYIAIVKPKAEVYLAGIDHSNKQYKVPSVREYIEEYDKQGLLKIYQTDINSKNWKLEYKEINK